MFSARTAWDRTPNLLAIRRETLRARGVDVVDLTVSNPTDVGLAQPERELREALSAASVQGYAPEPFGLLSARAAVAAELVSRGAHLSATQVFLSASTSEAYGLLLALLCDPGDNLLIPMPGYPVLSYLADAAAVELRGYPLELEVGFGFDTETLEALADENTRGVLMVSPANPTGQLLAPESQVPLDSLCASSDWALVVDEVFSHFVSGGRAPSTAAALEGEALTFTLGGLSKSVGLPQLKCAWTAVTGAAPLRDEALARLEVLLDSILSVAEPTQRALPRLLALGPPWRHRVALRLEDNRRALLAARPKDAPWNVLPSEGGWSAVLRLPQSTDETSLALELLEAGVHVQPGHFYDFPRGRFVVLSLLPEPARFALGVQRLARTLARVLPAQPRPGESGPFGG
ncbi:MAG: pyridoxal phosphate-dependent aminotransferase [Myxococcaceae bacterium]